MATPLINQITQRVFKGAQGGNGRPRLLRAIHHKHRVLGVGARLHSGHRLSVDGRERGLVITRKATGHWRGLLTSPTPSREIFVQGFHHDQDRDADQSRRAPVRRLAGCIHSCRPQTRATRNQVFLAPRLGPCRDDAWLGRTSLKMNAASARRLLMFRSSSRAKSAMLRRLTGTKPLALRERSRLVCSYFSLKN